MMMKSPKTIYGLVLAGGKSTRMGQDKSLIQYHGIPQREHLYNLLEKVCDKAFFSIRKEQEAEFSKGVHLIIDKDEYRGPYNGLLSAYKCFPDAAWLVLACDLPLMDLSALQHLVRERKPDKRATAFATRESRLPEPLCALWESKGLEESITYLENGLATCPRKFLIAADTHLVYPEDERVLLNANSMEDYHEAIAQLKRL